MSPTYTTARLLVQTAKENGWTIIPATSTTSGWACKKDHVTIRIHETNRGGLQAVHLCRQVSGGSDCIHLNSRTRRKRQLVISWLTGEPDWARWGFHP